LYHNYSRRKLNPGEVRRYRGHREKIKKLGKEIEERINEDNRLKDKMT